MLNVSISQAGLAGVVDVVEQLGGGRVQEIVVPPSGGVIHAPR